MPSDWTPEQLGQMEFLKARIAEIIRRLERLESGPDSGQSVRNDMMFMAALAAKDRG